MKICIISPALLIPPTEGGAIETLVHETVPFYKKSEVEIYSVQSKSKSVQAVRGEHYCYYQIPLEGFVRSLQTFLNRFARRGLFTLYDYFFIGKLIKIIKPAPDVIHVHNNLYYVRRLKKYFPKTRVILHMHNDCLFKRDYLLRCYKQSIDAVDKVIAVSHYIAGRIISFHPECAPKIQVVGNGVSLIRFEKLPTENARLTQWRDKLGIQRDDKVLIFVGRIDETKGVHVLLDAFRSLKAIDKRSKLLIVGSSWFVDGKTTPYYRRIVQMSKELEDGIIFTGFISHENLKYLYNLATICVIPSICQEAFALVTLEAMACGCVVVASAVGGIPELVKDGKTGVLVEPNNPNALHAQLTHLLKNESLAAQLSKNALSYVQHGFDWPNVAGRYEELYEEALRATEPRKANE